MPARKNDTPPPPVTPAEEFVENLTTAVEAFQESLSEQESVQAVFMTPAGEPLLIESVGAIPPSAVVFEGFDAEGIRALSVVPTAQAHLTLKAIPADQTPGDEPRRLGFITSRDRIVASDAVEP
ncbi:MAG: hypothetical protein QM758_09310 [Armatimonas sp.]